MTNTTTPKLLRKLVGTFARRRKIQFVGVFALTLVGAAAELIGIGAVLPFLRLVTAPEDVAQLPVAQWALQMVGGSQPSDLIVPAAMLLVVAAVISAGVRIGLMKVTFRYVAGLTHDLALKVFGHIIRQPYSLYVRRNSAEALSGVEKVNYVGAYLISPILQALSAALIAVAIILFLLWMDPVTALIAGGSMAIFYGGLAVLTRPTLYRKGVRLGLINKERIKIVQESLGGIRDIILDQSHGGFEWQFARVDSEGRRLNASVSFISYAPRYMIEGMGIVMIALLAVYYTGRPGGVTAAIPILGALALGSQRLLPLLQSVNVAWVQYVGTIGMLSDVFDLLDAPVLPPPARPSPDEVVPLRKSITLRGVGFTYGGEVRALDGIDMVIEKGSRVGFIGKTGSGKSTLIDLLMGLLEPTSGAILIDGVPLTTSRVASWQTQIAHVPQSIFLTDSTIASNIAFGRAPEDIDMERVRDAARRANIAAHIETLSEGYETEVGERGIRLSGGQRQRIGIARALYKQASVLVLDEATSALDDETETAVMQELEALEGDITVLMIAHRLSTVATCDKVVRLEGGRVAEQGSYDAVIAKNGAPVE